MLSLLLAISATACSQSPLEPSATDEPASIEIGAPQILLLFGGQTDFVAEVQNGAGRALPNASVRWSSGDAASVDVKGKGRGNQLGEAKGLSKGTSRVTAKAGASQDSTQVIVVDSSVVTGVRIVPSGSELKVGQSLQLVAEAFDANGTVVYGATFTWRSSAPEIASVTSDGLLDGRSIGHTTVTVEYDAFQAQASLDVMPAEGNLLPLPAFPGAEGFGALALNRCRNLPVAVHHVTAASGSGPGTFYNILRNRISNSRFDIVVFDIGGTITVDQSPQVKHSCIYIAGQTAPGDGVQIASDPLKRSLHNLRIRRNDGSSPSDIVVRYLRMRPGKGGEHSGAWKIANGHDIIFDHLSVTFSNTKEAIWTHAGEGDIRNLTVQWSTNSATLAPHSLGILVGSDPGAPAIEGISFHHNLFAHNGHRNPMIKMPARKVEMINNIVYNWGNRVGYTGGDISVDFINNYYKKGPASGGTILGHQYILNGLWSDSGWNNSDPHFLYLSGNVVDPGRVNPVPDQMSLYKWSYYDRSGPREWSEPADPSAFVDQRQSAPAIAVSVASAEAAFPSVLQQAGASARLSCDGRWMPARDDLDLRIARDVENSTGPQSSEEKDHQDDFGGYPDLRTGPPCADTDGDGMPDAFEERFGLSPKQGDAALDLDGDGYLNIEEYLNGTSP